MPPMNVREMMEQGVSQRDADRAMHEKVFGQGFETRNGRPVERGIGSAAQPTEGHFKALEKAEGKEVADRARKAASERQKG